MSKYNRVQPTSENNSAAVFLLCKNSEGAKLTKCLQIKPAVRFSALQQYFPTRGTRTLDGTWKLSREYLEFF